MFVVTEYSLVCRYGKAKVLSELRSAAARQNGQVVLQRALQGHLAQQKEKPDQEETRISDERAE